jgi:hypothetical protein
LSPAAACALTVVSLPAFAASATDLGAIKNYLVGKVTSMDKGAHDYVTHAQAYDKIIRDNGGDYNAAALKEGAALNSLIGKMQGDYKVVHNTGYETIEGITAGTKRFVQFDNDLDAGVPKAEATTDSPSSQLVLKNDAGKVIFEHSGNLFHYVMEPALWGTRPALLVPLDTEAAAKAQVKALPKTEIILASAKECAKRMDTLLTLSQGWQPTLDECVGALVWMTPTLNSYFDDWKDSRYNPAGASGRYVAESRVLDMRGIMSSLQLTYTAVEPEIAKKDPALAKRLHGDYAGILNFLNHVEEREKRGNKLTVLEIEEMANQAKGLTDQLVPKLKQVVALLGLKLPPKPLLA